MNTLSAPFIHVYICAFSPLTVPSPAVRMDLLHGESLLPFLTPSRESTPGSEFMLSLILDPTLPKGLGCGCTPDLQRRFIVYLALLSQNYLSDFYTVKQFESLTCCSISC